VSEHLDRRSFLKTGLAFGGLAALGPSGILAACGGAARQAAAGGGAATDTLRFAFLADMQVPDPDVFYEGEGLTVTLSCYDNLIRYKPSSAEFMPWLAESWEVSTDGLTYTFKLRSGVKFSDGTPFDAASMIASFERRKTVNQGPAYMLADVASTTAPDPLTLVVTLEEPVEPFLDYFACPWGPKPVSPALVEANAKGDDLAQEWLTTHSAGTGAYKIAEFVASSHYVLEANEHYWGTRPDFKTVRIEIIPDVTTQRLKLENGELDVVTKGLPIADIEFFATNPKTTVVKKPIATKSALYVNPASEVFKDKAVRQALRVAFDRKALIEPTYKDTGTLSTEFYPAGFLPDGAAPDNPADDPSKLKALVPGLPSKKVDLAYDEQGGATDRRLAELMQAQLSALGLDVTVRGIPTSQAFSMYNTPEDQRPDLMLNVAGGDAMNPDTQLRIFFRTGAEPLNWFNYALPELDTAMDAAIRKTTPAEADKAYADAAAIVVDQAWMVNICDIQDVVITRAGVTNVVHDPIAGRTIRLHELKKG
jgi:peptide/nickel transport system substrate-binding protein